MNEWNAGPHETPDDGSVPVVVFRSSGDVEAEIVRALLDSYDIPCSLNSDITHLAYPFTVDGLGEVRISVPAPLAEDARAIIEAHRQQPGSDGPDEPGEVA
jgi:hypothetical protein